MKILIIGAGLGGLTAAIDLSKKGHHVKIMERKANLGLAGGAINLTTGASAVFKKIDLEDKVAAVSDHTDLLWQRDLLSGEVIRSAPLSNGDLVGRTLLRPKLLSMLYEEIKDLGVTIEFSSTVVDLAETSTSATLTLENGSKEHADLIIAADGVRSRMRPKILHSMISDPKELDPVHSDRTYYVTNFSKEHLNDLSGSSILFSPSCLNFWSSRDDRYVLSLYNPSANNLSISYCVHEPVDMATLWDENGDLTQLREKFAGKSHPELERALFAANSCQRWKLSQMPDLPSWRSPAGRLVLLGDAAHAMHPTAGQGYSSTVQEIAVLGHVLERHSNEVEKATRLWQEACIPRSNRLKAFAHFLSKQYEGDQDALAQAARGQVREAELRKTDPDLKKVEPDMYAAFAHPEFTCWLRRHDPLELVGQ